MVSNLAPLCVLSEGCIDSVHMQLEIKAQYFHSLKFDFKKRILSLNVTFKYFSDIPSKSPGEPEFYIVFLNPLLP